MFRILSRLSAQSVKYKQPVRFYLVQKKSRHVHKESEMRWNSLALYYYNSSRYNVFQKDSNNLYQFDDETKNVTLWENPKLQHSNWKQSTDNYTNIEMIQAFDGLLKSSIEQDVPLSDSQFDTFIDEFTQRLQFTLNELLLALQSFVRHPIDKYQFKQRNYIELFQAFDQASTIKAENLLPVQLLFISSIWYKIPAARKSFFSTLVSRLFNRYMKTMSTAQLSQALMYINSMCQPIEDIRAFENVFEEKIDEMTMEEFSTVLWTFIRLETKVEKQELKDKFFSYLAKQDLSKLNDSFLTKILIITSRIHTPKVAKSSEWESISQSLRKSLTNRSLKTLILMANTGASIRLFDNEIILNVFNRCLEHPEEITHLSMPDLEYFSRILTLSNYDDKAMITQIGKMLLEEVIKRLENVAQRGFYANFMNIVRNLTMIDVYDLELLDNIFRPDYIKFIHKNSRQVDMPMYEIDGYNRINLKSIYKGNVLSEDYLERVRYLVKWVPDQANRYKQSEKFSYAIEDVVLKLFKYYRYAHAIAHRRHADIFVCIDKNSLKPVDVTNNFPPLYTGITFDAATLTKGDPNLIIFAIISGHTKEFLIDNRNKCENIPIGHLAQKVEQLKILGYHPIVISSGLSKNDDENDLIETTIVNEVNTQLRAMGIDSQWNSTENV